MPSMSDTPTSLRCVSPRGFAFIGHAIPYLRDPLSFTVEYPKWYGDLVRVELLGMDTLLVSDPALIDQVLVKQHANFTKDWFLEDLKRVVGEGLLTSEGHFWKRQRRLAQPAFHRDRIASYGAVMVDMAERAAARWSAGETRDVHVDFMHLTLEIVARTLFGAGVEGVVERVGPALDAVMEWYANPLLLVTPWVRKLPLPLARRFDAAPRELDAVIREILAARRSDPNPPQDDLLAMLLASRDEDGSAMSDTQLRDEVMTIFLAGHETTAISLSWTMYLLATHPAAAERLRAELSEVLDGRSPKLEDLPRLRFTDAVVHESLRLYPPAWAMGREASGPFALEGIPFPAGINVWMSPWALHRDARRFANPLEFRPERWLDGLAKRLPKHAFVPFGGGPRICIGNAFAMMEINLVLATVAQRWRWTMAPGATVVPRASVTLRPQGGVKVVLEAARHAT